VCVDFLVQIFALFVSQLIFLSSDVLAHGFRSNPVFSRFSHLFSFSQQGRRAHRSKSQTKFRSSRSIFVFTKFSAARSASALDPRAGYRPRVLHVAVGAGLIHFPTGFFRLSVKDFSCLCFCVRLAVCMNQINSNCAPMFCAFRCCYHDSCVISLSVPP
jgi:hypothetical protein